MEADLDEKYKYITADLEKSLDIKYAPVASTGNQKDATFKLVEEYNKGIGLQEELFKSLEILKGKAAANNEKL